MDELFARGNGMSGKHTSAEHDAPEWAEHLARSVAHLAAQLTMTQIRLRALAGEVTESAVIPPDQIRARLQTIAAAETGRYLRENLGEALIELIDVEALENQIVTFLSTPESDE